MSNEVVISKQGLMMVVNEIDYLIRPGWMIPPTHTVPDGFIFWFRCHHCNAWHRQMFEEEPNYTRIECLVGILNYNLLPSYQYVAAIINGTSYVWRPGDWLIPSFYVPEHYHFGYFCQACRSWHDRAYAPVEEEAETLDSVPAPFI